MTITVGIDTYVTVAEANTYLAQSSRGKAPWDALADEDKEAALVSATRSLETLTWKGTKTDPLQPLAWPRTGVTDRYGVLLDPLIVPAAVKYAEIEWALELALNPSLDGARDFGSNDRRYKAGSVEIEFFYRASSSTLIAPTSALRWIYDLLASSSASLATTFVGGTCAPELFTYCDFARAGAFY